LTCLEDFSKKFTPYTHPKSNYKFFNIFVRIEIEVLWWHWSVWWQWRPV